MAVSRATSDPVHPPVLRRAASGVTALALLASAIGVAAGLQLAGAATGTIAGVVYLDADGDGTRGEEETGVGGVEVVATDGDGRRTVPVATATDGSYTIDLDRAEGDALGSGPYRVAFGGWSAELHETALGLDNGSSIQFVSADAVDVSLGLGPESTTIGNRVWLDLDGDGLQDPSEPGLAGATVELLDAEGGSVALVITDGSGTWQSAIDTAVMVRVDASTATGLPLDIATDDLVATALRSGDARIDSDLAPDGTMAIGVGGEGGAHSLDAGFTATAAPPVLDVQLLVAAGDGRGELIDADTEGPGAGIAWYRPRTPVSYVIEVANEGPGDLLAVALTEVPDASCDREPFPLAVGESSTWTCDVAPDEDATSVVATVAAEGRWEPPYGPTGGDGDVVSDRDDAVVRIVEPAIGIAVTSDATGTREPGAAVTYRYEVTNTGDIDLDLGSPARVVDDSCAAVTSVDVGDLDADGILDVEADSHDGDDALAGETWVFSCTTVVDPDARDLDVLGAPLPTLTNTATVLATPVESDGTPTGLGNVSKQGSTTIVVDDGAGGSAPPAPAPAADEQPSAPGSIGGRIWHDLDADGIQDTGEPGLPAVAVELRDERGAVVDHTTSGDDGTYGFTTAATGVLRIRVEPPAGHLRSPVDRGVDDHVDSDVAADGSMALTTLDASEEDHSWDAGFHQLGSAGDRVWLDRDADGTQDVGEGGIDGVEVRLVDARGDIAATAVTANGGAYTFADLHPGSYRLEVTTPVGMRPTLVDAAANDLDDSDLDPATGRTAPVVVVSGVADTTWDAGFVVPTVVLSAPEVNTAAAQLAITGRSVYGLVALATLLIGVGGSVRILSDRVRTSRLSAPRR